LAFINSPRSDEVSATFSQVRLQRVLVELKRRADGGMALEERCGEVLMIRMAALPTVIYWLQGIPIRSDCAPQEKFAQP